MRYQRGEPWWDFPGKRGGGGRRRANAADAWEEPIGAWLDGECEQDRYPFEWLPIDRKHPVRQVTVADVMAWALKVETGKQSRPEQMRVGEVLRRLGWQREQRRRNGRRVYLYVRPEEGG
ncbi:hypothetical protein LMH63_12720 [Spiribacter halobius]|uniref:hypothetical protein n=1 Tax=Sediminicurvatus halobius TaxID=2182432 RepID=UPI001E303BC1|nr:hypothetical protein [Spiribacter halobius]UEX76818.1 hypothetical protein LMH63_12720 [Spiribacter halobius]